MQEGDTEVLRTTRSKVAGVVLLTAVLVAGGCSSSKGSSSAQPASSAASPSATTSASSGTAATTATSAVVVTSSRGFDGTTVKVAGIGALAAGFAGAEIGAQARFKRANDTNELNGIKIQFLEMANDNSDPATALSEDRRLVSQDGVFAIVPDLSAVNPGTYLTAQHVPYLGYAFDSTYCSQTPSTGLWGFGFDGCLIPSHPPTMPDDFGQVYTYVAGKTAKTNPSAVVIGADIQSGKTGTPLLASAAEGAGFNVVLAKAALPQVVSDYTPYVQQWLAADGGKQPDVLLCELAAQCIGVWQAVKAAGYKGIFYTSLGAVDALVKSMGGTLTSTFYNSQPNAALTQMEADLQAFKPGTTLVGYANVPAYFAADMFVQALKRVGRDITPEAVQQALATQVWQIPGLVGPINYPASTVGASPACSELLTDDGTNYHVVTPYGCSSKTYPIDSKFTG